MSSTNAYDEELESLPRASFDSQHTLLRRNDDLYCFQTTITSHTSRLSFVWPNILKPHLAPWWPRIAFGASPRRRNLRAAIGRRHRRRHALLAWFRLVSYTFTSAVVASLLLTTLFFPSYTKLPPHYHDLLRRMSRSTLSGRGNPLQEKVFIAASIYDRDGQLARGAWGQSVLSLINLLGPRNVHLSIYENDAGLEAARALKELERKIDCEHSIVFEEQFDLHSVPTVKLPDGIDRVKRIAYLAEVRNRALRPLEASNVTWNKLLYLNDVIFDPLDAVQLLFSTNIDDDGRADYRAACAVDFLNPFKFYDTFATRDLDGYGMGVPFFPWFGSSGESQSRRDVLNGMDAVQVRSCWGGMVAFDAKFFQKANTDGNELYTAAGQVFQNSPTGLRFRSEEDIYWDASECCLIHADLQSPEPGNTGIFMNPYVRVAYDAKTLSWLTFTRRFERLYSPIQYLVNVLFALPRQNPRRAETTFDNVRQSVWVPDESVQAGGSFQLLVRTASHSGFCGRPALELIKEHPVAGEKNWEFYPLPL